MSEKSQIEWTDSTWNPVTGCTKISSGCKNCYAERFAERFRGVVGHPYERGFDIRLWENRLELPLNWKKPRQIFVNSMSDLFHEDIPDKFIHKVFDVMNEANWHIFQVLTKRPVRAMEMNGDLTWGENIWFGTSIENMRELKRIDSLLTTDAKVKFLSLEPLLGSLKKLIIEEIDWVIVGGESGPGSREMKKEWVYEIRDNCIKSQVPFFFKQWGGVNKKKNGRDLDGTTWSELPENFNQFALSI